MTNQNTNQTTKRIGRINPDNPDELYCYGCKTYYHKEVFNIEKGAKYGRFSRCPECTRKKYRKDHIVQYSWDIDRSTLYGFLKYWSKFTWQFKDIFKVEYSYDNAIKQWEKLQEDGIV